MIADGQVLVEGLKKSELELRNERDALSKDLVVAKRTITTMGDLQQERDDLRRERDEARQA